MKNPPWAVLVLIGVTAMWGLTFPLIKNSLADVPPLLFVLVRLSLAALVLLPFLWRRIKKCAWPLFWCGLILAFFNTVSYVCQTKGMQTISPDNSAFIMTVYVVLVPLFAPLFGLGHYRVSQFVAISLTMLGIYILTGAHFNGFSTGDYWTLLSSICYGCFVISLQKMTKYISDVWVLVFLQILLGIPLILPAISPPIVVGHWPMGVWIALLFCSLFATILCFYLQNTFQKQVSVVHATLIYALEPVFAVIFAYLINHEVVTSDTLIGGALVLSGLLLVELLPKWGRWSVFKKH